MNSKVGRNDAHLEAPLKKYTVTCAETVRSPEQKCFMEVLEENKLHRNILSFSLFHLSPVHIFMLFCCIKTSLLLFLLGKIGVCKGDS